MANNIREIRKSKGFTLEKLAEAVGTGPRTIQRFETGDRNVSLRWLHRIAKALEVTPSDLIADTTPPDISNARTLALMMADALAQEKLAQVRAKLSDILDQQLKALGIGMTPESFVNFVAESRAMAATAPLPPNENPAKKPKS